MSGVTPSSPPPEGGADPWAAFGYLVAGVALYGLLGWGLGRWLNAPYLTPLGIVIGMAFGLYLVFHDYFRSVPSDKTTSTERTADTEADATRPDNED